MNPSQQGKGKSASPGDPPQASADLGIAGLGLDPMFQTSLTGLRGRAIRGAGLTLISQILRFVLTLGTTAVMARLLTPGDFGLVAMATAITGFVALFKDAGLSYATIQRPQITPEQISTLFWVNLLVSLVLMGSLMAAAPLIALMYGEPRLLGITLALAATFVFGGFTAQHLALLRRQLKFRAVTLIELTSLALSCAAGIGLAWSGAAYWSLVGMTATLGLVTMLGAWLSSGWLPGQPSRASGVRPMLRFGGTMLSLDALCYVANNVDSVLLGWAWGKEPLGLYTKAYGMLRLPTQRVNGPLSSVAVPTLARLQQDPERLRRFFINAYSFSVAISTLILAVAAVFAQEIVLILLGSQWTGVVRLFYLLAPAALAGSLLSPLGWILVALGRPQQQLRITVWTSLSMTFAFLVGLPYGPPGVALAASAMKTLQVYPVTRAMTAGTPVSWRDVCTVFMQPMLAGIAAMALGYLMRAVLHASVPAPVCLLAGGALMSSLYLGILLFGFGHLTLWRTVWREMARRRQATAGGAGVGPS
jgi:O-antigen/teichoic acid export membrane protein